MQSIALASLVRFLRLSAGNSAQHSHHPRQEPIASDTQVVSTNSATATATPDASSQTWSPGCTAELDKVKDTLPTPPPGLSSFSSSYYESHTRTAEDDCAWVTNIPVSFNDAIYDWWDKVGDWRFNYFDPVQESDKKDDVNDYITCVEESTDSFPCASDFWGHTLDIVLDSDVDEPRDDDGKDESSGKRTANYGAGMLMAITIFLGLAATLGV